MIDDVWVWPRALTAAEVAAQSGRTTSPFVVAASVASARQGSAGAAYWGDMIVVTLLVSEPLATAPVVTIGGRSAAVLAGTGPLLWAFARTVERGEVAGPAGFEVTGGADAAGRALSGTPLTTATSGPSTVLISLRVRGTLRAVDPPGASASTVLHFCALTLHTQAVKRIS